MADSSAASQQDKAAKLAAARKRFEELKRKKQPAKKSEDIGAPETSTPSDESASKSADNEDIQHSKGSLGCEPPSPPISSPTRIVESVSEILNSAPVIGPHREHSRRQSLVRTDISRSAEPQHPLSDLSPETLPEIYRKQAATINELRTEKQHLLDKLSVFQNEAQQAKDMMVARDKALEDLASVSDELIALKEKTGNEQVAFREGIGEVSRLNTEISSLRRRISHLESQITQKDKSIADMRRGSTSSPLSKLETALKGKEEQLENMSLEMSELRDSLERSNLQVKQLSLERDMLESRGKAMHEKVNSAESLTNDLNRRLGGATDSLAQQATMQITYETRLQSYENKILEYKNQVTGLESTIKEMNDAIDTLRKTEKDSNSRYNDLSRKLINSQRENSNLQMRLAGIKSELQEFSIENQRLGGQLKGEVPYHRAVDKQTNIKTDLNMATSDWEVHDTKTSEYHTSGVFSEVDFRAIGSSNLENARISESGYEIPKQTALFEQKLGAHIFTDQVRNELGRWSGYKLDIRSAWGRFGDVSGGTFEV